LEQADLNSGLLNDYRLHVIPMTSSSPCGATFGSAAAQVIASGAIGAVAINASAECRYNAVSQDSWIQILSGGYGSGDGVLKYIVRANNGSARSGAIMLENSIITINQEAAGSPSRRLTRLPYNVVSAAYDKPLDKLVLISSDPNELHIYDPQTHADQAVPLALAPLSVAVRPDGLFAAVGHDGWVSYVNLQTAAVQHIFKVFAQVGNLILAGNGYAYFAALKEWNLYSLRISDGETTKSGLINNDSIIRLHHDENFIYSGGWYLTKWAISQGIASRVDAHIDSTQCQNLWLTEDGNRLITACGKAYRTSTISSEELQLEGTICDSTIVWAEEASMPKMTAVLVKTSSPSQGARELRIYKDADLQLIHTLPVNRFSVGDASYTGYGQFAFWNSEGNNIIVVENADTSAGLLSNFGISIMSPLNAKIDFNADSKPDLLWRNSSTGEILVWSMNGVVQNDSVSLGFLSDLRWKIAGLADFNGDNKIDILWRNSSTGENYLWYMDGTSCIGAATLPPVANLNWKIAGVGDFNNDSAPDIVWRNISTGENYVSFMDGGSPIGNALIQTEPDINWIIVGVGDFNNDFKADILWRNHVTGENRVWLMNGANRTEQVSLPSNSGLDWKIVAIEDYSSDGKVDILWRNSLTQENHVWFMNGTAFSSESDVDSMPNPNWLMFDKGAEQQLTGSDFNGDGSPDIFWRNISTGENYVWHMNGSLVIEGAAIASVTDQDWKVAGFADFNSDGKPDILWRNIATGENYIWLMNGTAVLGGEAIAPVGDQTWKIAGIADFNGDVKPDILWRNIATGENCIWLMNGTAVLGGEAIAPVGDQTWKIAGIADFNGDSKPDILWRNIAAGENYIWFMNETAVLGGEAITPVEDQNWKIAPQTD
jgi:hypothetical protein